MKTRKFNGRSYAVSEHRCEDTCNGKRCVLVNTHEGPHANYDTIWAYFKDGTPSVSKTSNPEAYKEIK